MVYLSTQMGRGKQTVGEALHPLEWMTSGFTRVPAQIIDVNPGVRKAQPTMNPFKAETVRLAPVIRNAMNDLLTPRRIKPTGAVAFTLRQPFTIDLNQPIPAGDSVRRKTGF